MRRKAGSLATVWFFLGVCPLVYSQDIQRQPSPVLPSELGPQLIAWSQLQKPQPVSQASSPNGLETPEQQPSQAAPAPDPQQQHTASLTGTIVKDGDHYILKVSDSSTYQLDDQEKAKQKEYEGKQVKVACTLDSSGARLHVVSIELIS